MQNTIQLFMLNLWILRITWISQVSLLLVVIKNLVHAGSASTSGCLCATAMKLYAFSCRKSHSRPCFYWFAARAWTKRDPVAGNELASLFFFFFFAYQIHLLRVIDTGDDINDKKPAPSYPSISEYWQFLVIVEP